MRVTAARQRTKTCSVASGGRYHWGAGLAPASTWGQFVSETWLVVKTKISILNCRRNKDRLSPLAVTPQYSHGE